MVQIFKKCTRVDQKRQEPLLKAQTIREFNFYVISPIVQSFYYLYI